MLLFGPHTSSNLCPVQVLKQVTELSFGVFPWSLHSCHQLPALSAGARPCQETKHPASPGKPLAQRELPWQSTPQCHLPQQVQQGGENLPGCALLCCSSSSRVTDPRNCFCEPIIKIVEIGPVLLGSCNSSALFAGWAGVQLFWLICCRNGELWQAVLISSSLVSADPLPVCEWAREICKPWWERSEINGLALLVVAPCTLLNTWQKAGREQISRSVKHPAREKERREDTCGPAWLEITLLDFKQCGVAVSGEK